MKKQCHRGIDLLQWAIASSDFESYQHHCKNCQDCAESDLSQLWQEIRQLPETQVSDQFEAQVIAKIKPKAKPLSWINWIEKALIYLPVPALAACILVLLFYPANQRLPHVEPAYQHSQILKEWLQQPILVSLKSIQKIYTHRRKQG